ncbi:ATP-binding protein [uncultured Gimesia sp.]|uniref:ATP-binding protein n=1 Tax=uncultured Gimesia sp. TaxID=1678688 RepID=UPI0026160683|nr:ATP-binding protein [uncultured Gimesia sp.]
MDRATITAKQRDAILSLEEDHFGDLKAKEIAPAKLTRSVSAFANSSGGDIYIGVDEINKRTKKRKWRGFTDVEEANAHLQVIENMAPLANHYIATFLEIEDETGLVLQVQVQKTKDILESSNGTPYVRKSAQNLPVESEEALAQLKLDKGLSTFEDDTVNTDVADVTNSAPIIEFLINVIPTAEPEVWLRKQKLIVNGLPTVAAVLLFAEEPQAILPKRSGIKIFRYKTKEDEGDRDTLAFDPLTIEGPLYDLIYSAVEKTKELVEDIKKMGATGLEEVEYPEETLHEILTNAILHRDYSIATDTQIRIFDNRIEIQSPGRLPGHITVSNILEQQFARNPKLVRLINKFPNPPNKDVGEGLNTAFNAMRKLRLKDPEIIDQENNVLVHIRHQSLASPEETVVEYLENNDEITNRVAREITGIKSENTMKNVFIRLNKKDEIEPVPGKSGFRSAWQKKR